MASSRKSVKLVEAAAHMRRLFGSRGGGSRQDVPITEEADGPLGSDKDQEARETSKKAQKQLAGQIICEEMGKPSMVSIVVRACGKGAVGVIVSLGAPMPIEGYPDRGLESAIPGTRRG